MDASPLRLALLADLPEAAQRPAFDAFVRLYADAFPEPDEQEDPAAWLRPASVGRPETVVLLAGADREGAFEVWGGLVATYFPESRCGLLGYLAVDVSRRRRGVGGRLVDGAIRALITRAASRGDRLAAVFGEAEDFRVPEIAAKGDMPRDRMVAHDRYGARWVPVDYVMPRLDGTKRRDPHLLLLAFPHPEVTLGATTVPLAVVEAFLAEYYAGEDPNPDDPRQGDEVGRMRGELEERARAYHAEFGWPAPGRPLGGQPRDALQVPFRAVPLAARPALRLTDVAVCLHFVTVDEDPAGADPAALDARDRAPDLLRRVGRTRPAPDVPDYQCPVYHSFETDVLSYRFQGAPPIRSACVSEAQHRVRVRFPEAVRYVAEGLDHELVVPDGAAEVEARATVTASRFPRTGVRIWHVALSPPPGGAFTELDVIRLIALYYHGQERTDLLGATRFATEAADGLALGALLLDLTDGRLVAERPAAGTVELNPAAGGGPKAVALWTEILSALHRTTEDDQEGFRSLEALYGRPEVRRLLDACCGVVSGHFDYDRMSFAEMQDTLAPDSAAGPYAVWLNRATLTNVDLYDQMFDRCGRTIGISPYLILPHAVLLHNEFVVDQAEEVARRAIAADGGGGLMPDPDLRREALADRYDALAAARRAVEHGLHLAYVPNVFHYPGERELYDVGSQTRGALEKKETVGRLYDDIGARLRDLRDAARERARAEEEHADQRRSFSLTVLSALLSLAVVLDVVGFFGDPESRALLRPTSGWTYLVVGVVVVGLGALYAARPRARAEDAPAAEVPEERAAPLASDVLLRPPS